MEKGQKILTKKKHVLEYAGVGHLAIAPFVTLINLIKESYKETPEIYHMLLIELSEYKPMLGIEHKEKVTAHIKILLTRKPHLAESLISMLPDSLSMTVSNTFIFPLQSLPSNMHAIVTSKQSEIYKRVAGKSEGNDGPSEKKSKFDPVTAMMKLVRRSYNYLPSPKPHIRNSSGSPELSYTKPISSSQVSSPKRPDEFHCIKSENLATDSVCQNSLSVTCSSPKQKNLLVAVKPIFTYPKALKPLNEDSMNEFKICQNTEAYQEEMKMSLKSVDEVIVTGNSAMAKSPVLNRSLNRSMENCSPTCSEDSASDLDNDTDAYVYEDNFCDAKEYPSLVSLDNDYEKLVRKGENDGSAMGNIATLSIADENNNDSTPRSFPYGQSLLLHADIDGDKCTGNANVHSDYRLKLSENNQDKIYTNGSIDYVDSAIHCLEQMVEKSIKRFESDSPSNSCTYSKQPVSIENSASVRSSETCTNMPYSRNASSDGVQLWINCKTSSNKEEFGMNEGNWDRRLAINQLPTDRETYYSTDDHKSAKLAQTITKLNNLLSDDCKRIYTCTDQHNMSPKSFDTSAPMITRSYRNGFPSGHHQQYICKPASTFSKIQNNHIFQYQRLTPSDSQPSCVMSHRPKIVYSDHNEYMPASYPYMTDRPNVPANCLGMSYPLPDQHHTSTVLPKLPSEQPFHLRNSQGWSLDALSGKVFSDCRFVRPNVRPNLHYQVKQNYGGTDNFWPNFHQLISSISPIESSLFSKAGSFEVPVSVASSTNPSFNNSSLHIRDYGATLPNVAMNGPIHPQPSQHFLNGAIASNIHPNHSSEDVGGHFLSRRSDQQIYFQYPEYGSADFQVDERGTSGSFRSSSETDFHQEREEIDERKHRQNGRIYNHNETSSNEVNFPAVERDNDSIHVAHLLASLADKHTSGISNVYVD